MKTKITSIGADYECNSLPIDSLDILRSISAIDSELQFPLDINIDFVSTITKIMIR